ncbi:uncharacterized protein LOC143576541 [Bidens hawaiensis]|uniref:uncharacterized protein LOC143576541 n=1 Tax=Bidens hawaiensis TaxID=980011 RepID=UPI00404B3575
MYIYDTDNEIRNRMQHIGEAQEAKLSEGIVRIIKDVLDINNELVKNFRTARDVCSSDNIVSFDVCLYKSGRQISYDRPASNTMGAIVHEGVSGAEDFDIVIRHKDGRPQRINKPNSLYMALQYPLLHIFGDRGWSPDMCLTNRLDYVRLNQNLFRTEFLQGVHDAIAKGDTEGRSVGKRVILPSSFTEGPRYMYKHYHDALAICCVYGNPQFFITFTCNVKWQEIVHYMTQFPSLKAQDRPDIVCRVFNLKVEAFCAFVKRERLFGNIVADLYTIEFQKRGLPHCHMLFWVSPADKIIITDDVDRHISAEIPNPDTDPKLYKIVSECMIHGPCGLARPNAPCMDGGVCSKGFPKRYQASTTFDKNGYIKYKRSAYGFSVKKNDIEVDNAYIVPYNRTLSLLFNAHINVEYCGWNMMIKYLFKYVSKGSDRIRFKLTQSTHKVDTDQNSLSVTCNEIDNFVDGRFICPHEAAWRIFNFPIHHRYPAVQVLAVHLENMQNVGLSDQKKLLHVVNNPCVGLTTLTEWFATNAHDPSGRHLRYIDFLLEYRWEGSVDGVIYDTYRSACEKLGLLVDDNEWLLALDEAKAWATPKELRVLFAHILLHCEVANPLRLWENQWRSMSDDITRNTEIFGGDIGDNVSDETLSQYVLYELEFLLNSHSTDSSLKKFGLPMPNTELIRSLRNRMLMEEKNYDREHLLKQHQEYLQQLHPQQRAVYNHVVSALESNTQVLAFVYGHGGTGKTFLWTTITSYLRSLGKIVLAVAASGIASLLLPGGRTAHSRFKIPIDPTNHSNCNISKSSYLSQLLVETELIIWDEAPTSNRKCFEALDRTLKDILNNSQQSFGGKSVLLGGDFRQTLPIKRKATKSQIISDSLPRSYLWSKFKIFKLAQNMRVHRPNMTPDVALEIQNFSDWLVCVGNGLSGVPDDQQNDSSRAIEIPSKYIIPNNSESLHKLIILNMLPGVATTYVSNDVAVAHAEDNMDIETLYPVKYLNTIKIPGYPAHKLQLKVNVPDHSIKKYKSNSRVM